MDETKIYLEAGEKKTFAGALDWPGWCRSAKDEEAAQQALIEYGPRYAGVIKGTGIDFKIPGGLTDLIVVGRYRGNATTEFGAPGSIPDEDREPFDDVTYKRDLIILEACWQALDRALEKAAGKELRKGPRGGGRDLKKIVEHVIGADQGYLSRLAWKHKLGEGDEVGKALNQTREAIRSALDVAVHEGLPDKGPRGGAIWPARYFVRRVAWHVLDHAWEIEDRIE